MAQFTLLNESLIYIVLHFVSYGKSIGEIAESRHSKEFIIIVCSVDMTYDPFLMMQHF